MGCGCGGRGAKREKTVWRVTAKDGTKRDFLTELEAKASASVNGGAYTRVLVRK